MVKVNTFNINCQIKILLVSYLICYIIIPNKKKKTIAVFLQHGGEQAGQNNFLPHVPGGADGGGERQVQHAVLLPQNLRRRFGVGQRNCAICRRVSRRGCRFERLLEGKRR